MDAYEMLSAIRNGSGLFSEQDISTRVLLRMIWDAELSVAYESPAFYVRTKSQSISNQNVDVPMRYKKLLLAWLGGKSCDERSPDEEWLLTDNINMTPSESYPKIIDFVRKLKIYPAPTESVNLTFNYFSDPVQVEYGIGSSAVSGTIVMDEWASGVDDYYVDEWVSLYANSSGVLVKKGRTKITDYVASTRLLTVDSTYGLTSFIYAIESFGTAWDMVYNKIMAQLGKDGIPKPEVKDGKRGK